MSVPLSRLLVGALCLSGMAGCGGGTLVTLQGRLAYDGGPVPWNEAAPLNVGLTENTTDPQKAGRAFSAEVGKDGRFTVEGGKGIPPGTYTFTVRSPGLAPGTRPPAFLAPFADSSKSPLKYQVTADPDQKIVIDLAKQTVQRET